MELRSYAGGDLPAMIAIWNQVVEDGVAFPQVDGLDGQTAPAFFPAQSAAVVAAEEDQILGLYTLHPNNTGRCGHIGNASYAVRRDCRGRSVGEALVRHSIAQARDCGFRLIQFNAVVCSNTPALRLYEKLGFQPLGRLPGGFLDRYGVYQDTFLFYYDLTQ